jgi:hypothetical protein
MLYCIDNEGGSYIIDPSKECIEKSTKEYALSYLEDNLQETQYIVCVVDFNTKNSYFLTYTIDRRITLHLTKE